MLMKICCSNKRFVFFYFCLTDMNVDVYKDNQIQWYVRLVTNHA